MAEEPPPAQKAIGDFAPKLVELTDEVLFGDIWPSGPEPPRRRWHWPGCDTKITQFNT
ncbi:hypothetical protein FHR32_007700 [Streptosporangium album]|uniref:Uncharacterized protein n=1 Tax=Streptosporangium album TaxID=47479 RepID=A0A7W7S3L3_9ACTN|nr:hypothetical protein [Streptosporangium album]MBB4943300.1 hypothetical protein [Streptosporangium album]